MQEELTLDCHDSLQKLHAHIRQIPADDELELRVAVHDLHAFATASHQANQNSIDMEILLSCSTIIDHRNELFSLPITEKSLSSYRDKSYIRGVNALVRTLLPKITTPQNDLCFDGLQFNKCKLSHLELFGLKMRAADLSHAKLSHSILIHADFSFANLMSASINQANLHHSTLINCEMGWCDLSYSIFHYANMMDADLGGAILDHADLSHALLYNAYFSNATLTHTNFSFAKLFAAQFNHAKLQGTNFTGTGITQERLEKSGMEITFDNKTIWGHDNDCAGRNPLNPNYYNSP